MAYLANRRKPEAESWVAGLKLKIIKFLSIAEARKPTDKQGLKRRSKNHLIF